MSVINKKILDIFNAINKFKYCIWKDTDRIKNLVSESKLDVEYDILLYHKDKVEFIIALEELGFILSTVSIPKYNCEIFHITKFTSLGYICFHVYTGVITGSHFSKEYDFPIPKKLWSSYSLINGVKVLNSDYRYALSTIRVLTKKSNLFLEKIKVEDLRNFHNSDEIKSLRLFDINSRAEIERYRYKSKSRVFVESVFYKFIFRLYIYINYGNKRVKESMRIAFVGTDGSGKSTVSQECYDLLRKKLPVRKSYLGSNFKNFSLLTWAKFLLYKSFFRYFSLLGMSDLRKYGLSLYELSRMDDIYSRYIKTKEYSDKGVIIIYDRFPIPGFLDFPTPETIHRKHLVKYNKYYKFWISEQELVNINLITADLDNIMSRRVMVKGELEDIIKKKSIESEYINGDSFGKLKIVKNNTTINDVISEVLSNE